MELRYRIALIVDNPFRDLPALTLVASKLCEQGHICYLVPFNLYEKEILFLMPDFVLLHYLRENNQGFVKLLSSFGIKLGILDTEGIYNNVPKDSNVSLNDGSYSGASSEYDEYYVIMGKDAGARAGIDCYCCWNESFANYLIESNWYKKNNVYVTGVPRSDLFCSELKNLSLSFNQIAKDFAEPLVLINGSFPLVQPLFQSTEKEIDMMVEMYHYDRSYMLEWVNIEREACVQYIQLSNDVAQTFPSIQFVFRPHPFENLELYEKNLLKLPNLHLIKKGSLDSWLHKASALIHYRNCTTSIEGGLANVPVFSADWLKVHKRMPQLENISLSIKDIDDLKHYINELLNKTFVMPKNIKEDVEKLKSSLYFKTDGKAHERVASAILNAMDISTKHFELKKARTYVNNNFLQPKNIIFKLIAYVRNLMNISIHWSFTKLKYNFEKELTWDKTQKHYSHEQVNEMLLKISEITNQKLKVRKADYINDYNLGYREGRSVVIEKTI